MMINFRIASFLIFFSSLLMIGFVLSCDNQTPTPTPPTTSSEIESYDFSQSRYTIPATENLFEYIYDNTTSSEAVILYIQGGPITQLITKVNEAPNRDPSGLSFYTRVFKDDYTVVQVQQINTYYPSFAKWIEEKAITLNFPAGAADSVSLLNAEIIKRVAKHFHEQNKKVYLYGSSYGSLLINLLIERYPNGFKQLITKTATFVGRLKPRAELRNVYGTPSVLTTYPSWDNEGTVYSPLSLTENEQAGQYGFLSRIIFPILAKDYIGLLASKLTEIDSKDIWYCTAEYDDNIGRLSEEETTFAKEHFIYSLIKGAPHGAFTLEEVMQATYDYFKNDKTPPTELTVVLPSD